MTTETPAHTEKLNGLIDSALEDLNGLNADTEEYASALTQLEKLYALKAQENPKPQKVSPDTLVNVSAHLAGIMLIVGHERAHVVASKAISFVSKLR